MGSRVGLRAKEIHALAVLKQEIWQADPHLRQQYLRNFTRAYTQYRKLVSMEDVHEQLRQADVVLVGDYHALPQAQGFAAELVEKLAKGMRPVQLGVEFFFSRDQRALEAWQRGEISEEELRSQTNYELEWGYDWQPYGELLRRARTFGAEVRALDRFPRAELSGIAARDRHAAALICEAQRKTPDSVMVALYGECHLAPKHLQGLLKRRLPRARVITVLQNIDALYWQSERENQHVEAVQVRKDVYCVFTATPLEKYASYRRYLDKWRMPEDPEEFRQPA
ncbi:MAG TPA: ChaN family lipoprotein [Candidatus Acidoferrales bacterium]|nr:ChaN family lipoprotein [Candidatus Acidoferrales bacterium]